MGTVWPKAMTDIPLKPRRKKVEVPVHKTEIKLNDNKKTFSANFHSKRCKEAKSPKAQKFISGSTDLVSQKVSRKYLSKENARITKENEEIIAKFNELEELSVRKIVRLKEKIATLQNLNSNVSKENSELKEQMQELFASLEDLNGQLEFSKHCRNCDEYKDNIHRLQYTNTSLEHDLNMMKTVVYRLNVQMDRYQEKLRSLNVTIINQNISTKPQTSQNIPIVENLEQHQDHTHTPISWGRVNAHTLAPLLDAYQDTIAEKDQIIENYETEIFNFTGQLKSIVHENELLHKSLTEDAECSSKLKIVVSELKKELKNLKEHNDMLIKKCALKQDKLDEVLKSYEYKVEQLKRDYGVVHEQYCRSRIEVTALHDKNKALSDAQEEFKIERQSYIPLSVHTSSVNECKRWYEELKLQYEHEKLKLKENIESQAKLIQDFEKRIDQHVKEKDEMKSKIKQLEKELKKEEAKYLELEHLLNEVQYAKSACRKQLNKAMTFAKDLVVEQETLLKALNQKQHENKAVKKIGFDISTKMDALRNKLKDVQRDAWQEFTTVEKKIQDQDDLLDSIKQEHCGEIEKLQNIIKEQQSNLLLSEQATLPVPPYVLFKDKHS